MFLKLFLLLSLVAYMKRVLSSNNNIIPLMNFPLISIPNLRYTQFLLAYVLRQQSKKNGTTTHVAK